MTTIAQESTQEKPYNGIKSLLKEFDRPGFFNIRLSVVDVFIIAAAVGISLV